jgi:hypothetical protein
MSRLAEKLTLLQGLLAISRRQTELLCSDMEADIAGPLEYTVEQREKLVASIDAIDAKLTPADKNPDVMAEIRAVLNDIQENDAGNRRLLEDAMQKIGDGMTRIRGARKQAAAYEDAPQWTGQRFDSKQ